MAANSETCLLSQNLSQLASINYDMVVKGAKESAEAAKKPPNPFHELE